jgi:hypothetical protein
LRNIYAGRHQLRIRGNQKPRWLDFTTLSLRSGLA